MATIEQSDSFRHPASKRSKHPGLIVWLTGFSGAGKTTLCQEVHARLLAVGHRAEVLDADLIRARFWPDLGYEKEHRDASVRRLGALADLISRHDVVVLVAAISPYAALRSELRSNYPNFVEVYVNAPIDVCKLRDTKGLYLRARRGEITNFTGISDPYEAPTSPDVECHTDRETKEVCTQKILEAIWMRF